MEFLKKLDKRPVKNPLPSWGLSLKVLITSLQGFMANLKDNIHVAQFVTKATMPTPILKVHISKCIIKRRAFKGMEDGGEIQAEYLNFIRDHSCTSPQELDESKIILFAHGGAFCVCTPKTHRGMAWRLSKYSKAKVLSIEYRLAPQHQFPAALQDMLSGYLYLIDPPQGQRKYHPSQVIFAGDSAGGNLSVSAVYWLNENSYPAPAGIVGLSPWLDLSHSLPSVVINDVYDYLPHQSKDPRYIHEDRFHYLLPDNENFHDALVSPLFGQSAQLKALPPMLLQVGDAEKLRDESILFSLLALKEGNKNVHVELYEDMVHVFHMFCPMDTLPKLALKRAGAFICSIGNDSIDSLDGEKENRSLVKWIQKDTSVTDIFSPIDILLHGYEKLKNDSRWGKKQRDTYQSLMARLSETSI